MLDTVFFKAARFHLDLPMFLGKCRILKAQNSACNAASPLKEIEAFWGITEAGTFVDGTKVSPVTLADLDIRGHTSLKVRIGIKEHAINVGGINIFGSGFGNYDQDIVMKMYLQ